MSLRDEWRQAGKAAATANVDRWLHTPGADLDTATAAADAAARVVLEDLFADVLALHARTRMADVGAALFRLKEKIESLLVEREA